MAAEIREIRVDRIRPNYRLVFDEGVIHGLCVDIGARGLREPIIIGLVEYRFEIIDGEKRWRACKKMGWETIKAVVLVGW
jgi:ParB family chromosome partitioning protein